MTNEDFYNAVSEILGRSHEGTAFPYYKRTRWNNRIPGRGRFPGAGIVRCFGETVHIALTSPKLNTTVNSKEEALQAIASQILREMI